MGQPDDYSPDDDSGRDKRDDYSPDDDSGRDKRDDWTPTAQLQFRCNSDGEHMS